MATITTDGVIVNQPASTTSPATSYTRGVQVNMDATGNVDRKDHGLEINIPGVNSARTGVAIRKGSNEGNSDFLRVFEYSTLFPGNSVLGLRINANAGIETRKYMTISGTVDLGSFPDGTDPRHAPTFTKPSAMQYMFGIFADVPTAFQTRLPDINPDDPYSPYYKVHWSILGEGGKEVMAVEKYGDVVYTEPWTPTLSGDAERHNHVLFRTGRIGRKGWGPKSGGVLMPSSFTVADLNGDGPDAYDMPGGLIRVPDATLPGLYLSNGFRWEHVADPTKLVGPDSFAWTPTIAVKSGSTDVVTQSGPHNRDFQKTAGAAAWSNAVYGPAVAGDQLVEFTVATVGTQQLMVGLATAIPTFANSAYLPTEGNLTGAWLPASTALRFVNAGSTSVTTSWATLAVGDRVTLRKVGSTITLEHRPAASLEATQVATITTTAPDVAYRPFATFNNVGGKVAEMRHRSI
jgi:hypothetical protein